MAELKFNQVGQNKFETGDDYGVLFVMADTGETVPALPNSADVPGGITIKASVYKAGVPWLGLTAVTKSPSGADETELWADNIKYGSFRAAEKFGATIESYTYPEEFEECDGGALTSGVRVGQQKRKKFAFVFRSRVGTDQNPEAGYKYHFIYNATASPSEQSYATVNDSPDAITFSHEISADAVAFSNYPELKPTSELTVDYTALTANQKAVFDKILAIVYGQDEREADSTANPPVTAANEIVPQLPSPDDILRMMATAAQG